MNSREGDNPGDAIKKNTQPGAVTHTCYPSYSGGRDQKDQLEASPGRQFTRPYLEETHHKKGLMEWLKVYALSSNPSTAKK
jgi:hypothetical protein